MKARRGPRGAASAQALWGLVVLLAFGGALAGAFVEGAPAADGAWVKQTSGTTSQLNAVFFLDELTGWAVGNRATVLHTTNGGTTWTAQTLPDGLGHDLTGIDFIDSQTGWIAAKGPDDLKVLHTQNGGATWVAVTIPNVHEFMPGLSDVDFFDADHGVAGGLWSNSAFNRIYGLAVSDDGGLTWRPRDFDQYVLGEPTVFDVEWADATNVWACGDTALSEVTLIRSRDRGVTWATASTPIHGATGDLQEVEFVDASHGWSVSDFIVDLDSGNGPVLLYTDDGGGSWTHRHWSQMGLAAANRPMAIDFVDQSRGWMVGKVEAYGRNTWHTTDGGLTWSVVALPETRHLLDVDFVSVSCGWAVGWSGSIYHYAIPDVPTDTTPPVTTASGYDDAWHNHNVNVYLTVVDTGSGPDRFETSFDGGSWTPFDVDDHVGIVVPAMSTHANDGARTVAYRGVDKAGNVETPKTLTVKIDTRKPTTKAPSAATARRGRTATLKYRVLDTTPNGGTAKVTVKVKNRAGKAVKTLTLGVKAVNTAGALTAKFTVPRSWKAGTYEFFVSAVDAAGNRQANVASNRLIVK